MITSFTSSRIAHSLSAIWRRRALSDHSTTYNQTDVWLADRERTARVNEELARFARTTAICAIWRQAGNPATPAAGLHTVVSLPCRRHPRRKGRLRCCWWRPALSSSSFMIVAGDQSVMIATASADTIRRCSLTSGATLPTRADALLGDAHPL